MRTETFSTPRPLAVRVKLPRGDVQVETADVEETTVSLTGSSERARQQIEQALVRLDDRGDRDELVVDADTDDFSFGGRIRLSISFGDKDAIRIRVVCPHGVDLSVETGSADTRATGRFGSVTTKTGDVAAGPVAGRAQVKTAAGDVNLKEVASDVAVTSASGDVVVGAVTQGTVELKSVSGDLVVGIRRGSRVWMDVKTVTGDARSELDAGVDDDGEGPLVELKATAMSGDIRIVRA